MNEVVKLINMFCKCTPSFEIFIKLLHTYVVLDLAIMCVYHALERHWDGEREAPLTF